VSLTEGDGFHFLVREKTTEHVDVGEVSHLGGKIRENM
jgi:hypothetical protein